MYAAFIFINLFIAGLLLFRLFDVRPGKGGAFGRTYWRAKVGLSLLQALLLTLFFKFLLLD